jgi:putative tryptophan/tyrosine transport system substrate-binding protein
MIRRRELIAGLGGAAVWPLAARVQRRPPPLIGVLGMYSGGENKPLVERFRKGLKAAGYIEGENVEIDWRWADWQPAPVAAMVADLLRRRATVIVSAGAPLPAIAAKRVTSTTPIVFVFGSDPVELGLVDSLSRPGGNVTGVIYTSNLEGKRLDLLGQLVPQATTIGYLSGDPNERGIQAQKSNMLAAAASVGKEMIVFDICRDSDIDAAFYAFVERRVGALAVGIGAILRRNLNRIVALAALHMIPAIYPFRDCVLGWRLDQLRRRRDRRFSACRCLCRADSQWREIGRSAGAAVDRVRSRYQSQNCQKARHRDSTGAYRVRQRVHRMRPRGFILGIGAAGWPLRPQSYPRSSAGHTCRIE